MPSALDRSFEALRTAALAYPESHEDHPWGHSAIKIKTKVFVFLYLDDAKTQLTLSAKLPHSSEVALLLPFATPTGYGLARSGWVTATFTPQHAVPVDLLRDWIDESYRAIAPAKLIQQLTNNKPAQATNPATKPAARPSKPKTSTNPSRSATPSTSAKSPTSATPAALAKPTRSSSRPAKPAKTATRPAARTKPTRPAPR